MLLGFSCWIALQRIFCLQFQIYDKQDWLKPISRLSQTVVYFDQQTHACACICMVENDEKHWKMMKKVPFLSCAREAHVRSMKKSEEKTKLATSIWVSASFWESLPIADQQNLFFFFSSQALHKPLVRMMEKVLFHDFHCFRPCKRCASMHSLVEIHNTKLFLSIVKNWHFLSYPLRAKQVLR